MPKFDEAMAGIGQGTEDIGRSAYADIGNAYQEFLTGRTMPMAPPTGDMEWNFSPNEPQPMSYGEALRTYSDLEQAEVRAKHEAGQQAHQPDVGLDPEP